MLGAADDSSRGVYGISVAADLTGLEAQSLRLYERRGLLEPSRTPGGTRLYSSDDVERLHRIRELLGAGVNLTGIGLVLDLQDDNGRLNADNDALRAENDELTGRFRRRQRR